MPLSKESMRDVCMRLLMPVGIKTALANNKVPFQAASDKNVDKASLFCLRSGVQHRYH
jgi:hypothetical protein